MYYVVDTNVIIDYTDIIPNGEPLTLEKPTIDLTGHCLVIPETVLNELDKFKSDQNDRGHAAREALGRLSSIFKQVNVNIEDVNTLKHPIMVENGGYSILALPVDCNFYKSFSFKPADDDKDGQIILAALATLCCANGVPVTGKRLWWWRRRKLCNNNVVLLTNDRCMAVRARAHGIAAERFKYSTPAPYTGRRDLAVPDKLFIKFYSEGRLSNEEWQQAMPKEEPLVANEYLIMQPESGKYPEGFNREDYAHVGKYNVDAQSIERLQYWRRAPVTPRNEGQAIFNDALADPNITCVIGTGPAGTGKTYLSTVYGWQACKEHRFDGVVVVPCDPENSNRLGALPGDMDAKMDPTVRPHKNALENFFLENWGRFASSCANNPSITTTDPSSEEESAASEEEATPDPELEEGAAPTSQSEGESSAINTQAKPRDGATAKKAKTKSPAASDKPRHSKSRDKDDKKEKKRENKPLLSQVDSEVETVWGAWFRNTPIYFARGLSFPGRLVLYDEFQDQNRAQAFNLLTRKGGGSKMVITGDIEQIHSAYLDRDNNGLVYARQLLKGHPLVAQITFLPSECVRDPLVRFVVENKASQTKISLS
ncbi:PhoH family protein [Candidatus Saccharibacteria bacterium]|nr:PhoH family protein [Candidatus Saccharibacteria bacterium]